MTAETPTTSGIAQPQPTTSAETGGRIERAWRLLDDARPVSRSVLIFTGLIIAASYALLWTRYFYPLADSALYLGLARSIADGHGFLFMDIAYKRITPLHPLMLAGIIKLGGGIGAIHAVNIILMLAAHVLCFFTLSKWFNQRLALLATVATASQFWVFRNGMFVLTEPPFMLMVWAGLLPLAYVSSATGARQWILVILGCFFLACAFETRVAGLFLMPGVVLALWLSNPTTPPKTRAVWLGIFAVVFGILIVRFWRSPYPQGMAPAFVERQSKSELARASMSAEDRYSFKLFQGVTGPIPRRIWKMILIGGRWINESFAAPVVYFTQTRNEAIADFGNLLALLSLGFLLLGWVVLALRRMWWPFFLSLYAAPFWLMWASRIIPRYLIPVAPEMFVMVVIGMALSIEIIALRFSKNSGRLVSLIAWVPAICLTLVVLGNAGPYGVEVYVHKFLHRNYYDVARQGGIGELLDIGAYIQKNARPGETVYVNTGGMAQRVVFYLGGAKTDVPHDPDQPLKSLRVDHPETVEEDNPQLSWFFKLIDPSARFAVVYSTLYAWPEWYFPLDPKEKHHWWFLFQRDPATGVFYQVVPPKDRDYASGIPPSKMVFEDSAANP